jgi:hypothetical protein
MKVEGTVASERPSAAACKAFRCGQGVHCEKGAEGGGWESSLAKNVRFAGVMIWSAIISALGWHGNDNQFISLNQPHDELMGAS